MPPGLVIGRIAWSQIFSRSILMAAVLLVRVVSANPAPAPVLQTPTNGIVNFDPDGVFRWTWIDDLINNGSFESGMTPGWYTAGPNPGIWSVYTISSNTYGMGYRFATTTFPMLPTSMGQLIQDVSIPSDATSATLQWSEQIVNYLPQPYILTGRLRVVLYQGGAPIALLEDARGYEPQFLGYNFVTRITNLLAYAGQSLSLVFQADCLSTQGYNNWFASIDGVSFSCDHPSRPDFQVLVGKSSTLTTSNQIGTTSDLSLSAPPLATNTTYFWKVGSVRDGVTNFSTRYSFKTGARTMPTLKYQGSSPFGLTLQLSSTKTNRSYTIEQRDGLENTFSWYDIVPIGPGTGAPTNVNVPVPSGKKAFWRARVDP
jgi:hypothetical protein